MESGVLVAIIIFAVVVFVLIPLDHWWQHYRNRDLQEVEVFGEVRQGPVWRILLHPYDWEKEGIFHEGRWTAPYTLQRQVGWPHRQWREAFEERMAWETLDVPSVGPSEVRYSRRRSHDRPRSPTSTS